LQIQDCCDTLSVQKQHQAKNTAPKTRETPKDEATNRNHYSPTIGNFTTIVVIEAYQNETHNSIPEQILNASTRTKMNKKI